jgi:branched-chain amino acid transport system substrate-binding protein
MISPSSTNPKVTQVGDYIFRVCFLDSFQGGKVLARFAHDTLKAKSVAVLKDVKSDYSVGLAGFFEAGYTNLGGTIVAEQNYSGGDKDFNAQLTAIKAANPDAVFVPGYYTEVGLIALQAAQLGLTAPLFGGDGWESSVLLSIGGPALEGDYFSTHYSPDDTSPAVQLFVQHFKDKYGATPDSMAALGYDSALILVDAIRRAGTTGGPKIRDTIAATTNFPGISGTITIDENRNASKSAVIVKIQNGKPKYVQTIQP